MKIKLMNKQEESKEMELLKEENKKLTEEIRELKLKNIDTSKYEEWNWQEILYWMLSLENGRFKKYENLLLPNLKSYVSAFGH